jgi:hypothetical protein
MGKMRGRGRLGGLGRIRRIKIAFDKLRRFAKLASVARPIMAGRQV